MPTIAELKTQIDNDITNKTAFKSITPLNVGKNLKDILDLVNVKSIEKTGTVGLVDTYTVTYSNNTTSTIEITNGQDAESVSLTSGVFEIPGTLQELPYDINQISVISSLSYLLPVTTQIGKTIIVIGDNTDNSRTFLKAYADNSPKMFITPTVYISELTLEPNQIYKFTYLGFGTGDDGEINGIWMAQEIKKNINNLQKTIIYPSDFTAGVYTLSNDDNYYTIIINNGTDPVEILAPNGLMSRFQVGFFQKGTADVTLNASGVKRSPIGGYKIRGQYYDAYMEQVGTSNEYYFAGDLKV